MPLYLHVTLLSDITDIKGISLVNDILIGSRRKNRHQNSSWSLQQKPNIYYWNLWNRTIRHLYCCTFSSTQLKKQYYLQRWYPDRHTVYRYQYSPTEHELFEFHHSVIFRWFVTETSNSTLVKVPDIKESTFIQLTYIPIIPSSSIVITNQYFRPLPNSRTLTNISTRCRSGHFYSCVTLCYVISFYIILCYGVFFYFNS